MDVINMISKDTSLPDAEPRPGSRYGPGDAHFTCGPRTHEFLKEMHREVFAGRPGHLLTIGEMPDVTIPQAVLFTAPERRELDMVFQFEHVRLDIGADKYDLRPLRLADLKASMAAWQAGLAAGHGWNSLYWSNHDQPRPVSRFGDEGAHRVASAKTLATVLLVAANFTADVVSAVLPLDGDWADTAVVLTSLPGQTPLLPPPDLKLRAWESVIWRRTR
jgi:oligo-1,6-glucosidase